jgi:hypothetical protein
MRLRIFLYIAFALMILSLWSCVTAKKCADKFGTEIRTIIVRDTVPVVVETLVPADSVELSVPLDTLVQLLKDLQADTAKLSRTLETSSASGELSLQLWINKYNRLLKVKAAQKPRTIIKIVEVPVETEADCPPAVVVDPDEALAWHEKIWKGFQFFSAIAMLLGIALIFTVLIVKHKPWKLW